MNERNPDSISEIKRERYRNPDMVETYDSRYRGGVNQLNTLVERAWIAKHLAAGPVLDAGAGTGRFSAHFSSLGYTVTALDSSPAMLSELRAKAPDVETVLGDLYCVPFENGRFANVVCMHVLFHLPDWQRVLAELVRVTAPGGRIFFEMRSGEHAGLFGRAAKRLGLLRGSGGDEQSATIHVTTKEVTEALNTLGADTAGKLRYDLPHSYWFRPLLKPSESLLARFAGLRGACSSLELAAGGLLPASMAYRTLYMGRKR